MAYEVTRTYWFSAAHRLEGHPKCGRLHGHNYRVDVTLHGPLAHGMVIDFGLIDSTIEPILEYVDHRYLVSQENSDGADRYANVAPDEDCAELIEIPRSTAECLARWFADRLMEELFDHQITIVRVKEVTVWETHRSKATYTIS